MKRSLQLSSLRTSARFASVLLLLPIALLCGCGGSDHASLTPTANTSDTTNGPVVSTSRTVNGLEITTSVPKATYALGEAVPLTTTVKNVGSQAIKVSFNSCQVYYRVAQNSQVVGPEGVDGLGCSENSIITYTLAPGETHTDSDSWNQKSAASTQVGAGQYSLNAASYINTSGTVEIPRFLLASDPVTITIAN